ncbi:type II 3-dehydroquinate dehydratase [Sphingomicrobium sediminis]|uniref:type II 3-dehydroquinate dehydratase n=1 Tax=Sphingomicrobium sediminis TaxID=2950949 RepID=UPI00313454C7
MTSPAQILVLNGPNLNLLGTREPRLYGTESLDDITLALSEKAAPLNFQVTVKQSNHEGQLIDWLHEAMDQGVAAIIFNAGAYSHTSIAIRDAVAAITVPVIEVHISNIYAREGFRRQSLLSQVSVGGIQGLGTQGYLLALDAAHRIVQIAAQQKKARGNAPQQQGISDAQKQRH